MRTGTKISLVALSLLLGAAEVLNRVNLLSEPEWQVSPLIAFAGLYMLCAASLCGFALLGSAPLRWLAALLLAAGSVVVDSYQWVVGDFMNYEAFVTMAASGGEAGNALAQQGPVIMLAAAKGVILLAAVGIRPPAISGRWPRVGEKLLRGTAFPILVLLAVILFFRGGDGSSGLPAGHAGASFAILSGYELVTADRGPREPVTIEVRRPQKVRDIVLIIDESIAGAYLDINSANGVYSGLDRNDDRIPVHNFGLATSITHCSVGSNLSLRFGGTRDNYRETARSKPAIWAYAKEAGLATVYLDGQRTGGQLQNGMTREESLQIDHWEQFEDVAVIDRDHAIADRLAEYLEDGIAQFILVNKVGAHFPVSDKFPMSHARYRPMLKRGQYVNVTDSPTRDGLDGRQSNWVLYRNSYRNTVTWMVGGFFDRLLAVDGVADASIIYTADHGQSFHERGEESLATHCTPNPEIEEGVVPLLVIGDGGNRALWAEAAARGKDGMSHYRIFPTLLHLMGYREKEVRQLYGPDLAAPGPDPFTFNKRYNARLGSEPSWVEVEREKIARPPSSDYAQTAGHITK